MISINEKIEDAKIEIEDRITDLISICKNRIDELEKKLQDTDDWETLYTDFCEDPARLSKEEVGGLFNHYNKRALRISAWLSDDVDGELKRNGR